ncbi:unnamed protein product [Durusdinium trenchii]|uniref:Uncharacterized protein n=1 Tax=Durusdinium trenchii TaxID=1381693 RepID=A0ABP0S2E8_9DINO
MENVAEASPPPGDPAPNPADPPGPILSPTSPAEPAGDAAAPVEADEDNKTVLSDQTCLEDQEESLGDVTEGSTDLEAAGQDLDKLNAGSSSAAGAGPGAVAAGPGVTSSGSTVAAGLSAPASDAAGSSPMTSGPGSAVAEAARGSAEGPPANVALGATATTADPGPTTAASMALDGYDSKRDYQRKVVGTGIREIGIVVDQEALMDQVVLVDLDRRLEARRPRLSLEKGAFANWLGWEVLERVKWRCDDERLLGSLRLFGPPFFTPWQRLTGPPLRLFAACGSLGRWALRLTGPPLLWVSGSLGRCLAAALRAAASRLSGPRFGSGSMGRCIAALWAAVWQRLYGPLHRGSLGRCLQRLYGPLHRGSLGRCLAAALWDAASRLSGPLID